MEDRANGINGRCQIFRRTRVEKCSWQHLHAEGDRPCKIALHGAALIPGFSDNFCSIVTAVENGRAIYAGIQRFVAFIMPVHIAEITQIFVNGVTTQDLLSGSDWSSHRNSRCVGCESALGLL